MKKLHSIQTAKTSSNATYQDVLDAPPHMVAQIVDGKLYTFPRPGAPHQRANLSLSGTIDSAFRWGEGGPGGWWIFTELEVHLGTDILVPDIAGWRRERVPEEPTSKYMSIAPDWVCEILSPTPNTRKLDLGRKRAIYAREHVPHYWIVDPVEQSLEVSELRGAEWRVIDKVFGYVQVSLPPFDAITFDLGKLWPQPTIHRGVPEELAEYQGQVR